MNYKSQIEMKKLSKEKIRPGANPVDPFSPIWVCNIS